MAAKQTPKPGPTPAASLPAKGGAATHCADETEVKPAAAEAEVKPDPAAFGVAKPMAATAKTAQPFPAPSMAGLGVVLFLIAILICIAAAMRIDRPIVRDRAVPATAASLELRIDLNTATEAELQLLPMIGPALSERIVDDRERNGPFVTIDDLARVRGIGRVIIERIVPYAIVEP